MDQAVLSQQVGCPKKCIRLWHGLWRSRTESPKVREHIGRPAILPRTRHHADEEDGLLYAHGYIAASARSFIHEI